MPHSVLARPRQRPARASSPGLTALVQGRQPIERKPFGDQRMRRQTVPHEYNSRMSAALQPASGLTLMRSPSASNSGMRARVEALEALCDR